MVWGKFHWKDYPFEITIDCSSMEEASYISEALKLKESSYHSLDDFVNILLEVKIPRDTQSVTEILSELHKDREKMDSLVKTIEDLKKQLDIVNRWHSLNYLKSMDIKKLDLGSRILLRDFFVGAFRIWSEEQRKELYEYLNSIKIE